MQQHVLGNIKICVDVVYLVKCEKYFNQQKFLINSTHATYELLNPNQMARHLGIGNLFSIVLKIHKRPATKPINPSRELSKFPPSAAYAQSWECLSFPNRNGLIPLGHFPASLSIMSLNWNMNTQISQSTNVISPSPPLLKPFIWQSDYLQGYELYWIKELWIAQSCITWKLLIQWWLDRYQHVPEFQLIKCFKFVCMITYLYDKSPTMDIISGLF